MQEIRPGKYRHFKGGEYEVLFTARHSETEEPMVVYRALYGEGGLWVRPAAMWSELIERDGRVFRRFSPEGAPGPDLRFRRGTPADLEALTALEAACFPPAEAAGRERLRARLRTFPDRFWLLTEAETPIAYVDGCLTGERDLRDEMFADAALHDPEGDWQMLFSVACLPERQGLGYAGFLLRRVISDVRSEGRRGVVLTCKEALLPFYGRFGFRDEGLSPSGHGGASWHQMRLSF